MSDNMAAGSGSSNTSQNGSGHNSSGQSGSGQNSSGKPVADVKDLGGQLVTAARNGVNSLFEEQRNRAAEEIAALGEALQKSAQSMDGAIAQTIAPYAQDAAREVNNFADTLRNRSLNQIATDIEGFARKWPMAFIAAAVGVGFVAGRFLLSSGVSLSDAMPGQANTTGTGPQAQGGTQNRTPQHQPAASQPGGTVRAGSSAQSGAGTH